MKPDYSHLFTQFNGAVVTDDKNDTVKAELEKIAAKNGLVLHFNKLGQGGGATVQPKDNDVHVTLVKGLGQKWRILKAG